MVRIRAFLHVLALFRVSVRFFPAKVAGRKAHICAELHKMRTKRFYAIPLSSTPIPRVTENRN